MIRRPVTKERARMLATIVRQEGQVLQLARALKQARISNENWLWDQLRGALGALSGAPWGELGFRGPKKGGQAWEV